MYIKLDFGNLFTFCKNMLERKRCLLIIPYLVTKVSTVKVKIGQGQRKPPSQGKRNW